MSTKPQIDISAAHKYFSVQCFNEAWGLIDMSDRTPEEDEQMIRLSLASHWHWTRREDYTNTNASIAYWQTSRIYAILGQGDNARHYGQLCLDVSSDEDISPFFRAYAYEALARAESVAGNHEKMEKFLDQARAVSEEISDAEEKKMVLNDLETIGVF